MDQGLGSRIMLEKNLDFNQLVQMIVDLLKKESNPYLAADMEGLILDLCDGVDSQAPDHIPTQFATAAQNVANTIQEIDGPERSQKLKLLRSAIEQIQAQEITLWDSASLLLKLRCIKSLPFAKRESIFSMLINDNISSEDFLSFIVSHENKLESLKEKQLQNQLQFKGISDYQGFLQDIVKLRPHILDNKVKECLRRYRRRLSSLQTWKLTIKHELMAFCQTSGIIVKAQNKAEKVILVIQEEERQSTVTVCFEKDYITRVQVTYYQENLKPQIYQFSKAKSDNLLQLTKLEINEAKQYLLRRRRQLIRKMVKGEYIQQFDLLISHLMDNNLDDNTCSNLKSYSQAMYLTKLHRIWHISTNPKDQLIKLVKDANFHNFIPIDSQYFSKEMVEMLRMAEQEANSLRGKEIISFYGKTGAGKSTTINHYCGYELVQLKDFEAINSQFYVKEQNQEQQQRYDHAQIGNQLTQSSTVFSKGYSFLKNKYSKEIPVDKLALCDNPGFNDSRGKHYRIVTYYSLERAIKACAGIKAIVLVLQSSDLTTNRCQELFQCINSLKHLFPRLLDQKSQIFSHFFIFITKNTRKNDHKMLSDTFKKMKSQFQIQLRKLQSDFDIQITSANIKICAALIEMCRTKQIFFVDLSRNIKQREKDISRIIDQKGTIDKRQYISPIDNQHLAQMIKKTVSWCLAWQKIILFPFLKAIPEQQIHNQKKYALIHGDWMITDQERRELQARQQKKTELLKEIQECSIPLIQKQLQLSKMETDKISQLISNDQLAQCDQFEIFQNSLIQREAQLQKEIEVTIELEELKSKNAKKYQEEIIRISNMQKQLQQAINHYKSRIDSLSSSLEYLTLYLKQFTIGEEYNLTSDQSLYEKSWKEYFLHFFSSRKQIKVGERQQKLIAQFQITKDKFYLDYLASFDCKQLLERYKPVKEGYKLEIKSHQVVLNDFKVNDSKNILRFSVHYRIPENPSGQQKLPFLKIRKIIPGAEFNKDQIDLFKQVSKITFEQNEKSKLNKLQLQQNLNDLQKQIQSLKDNKPNLQLKLKALRQIQQEITDNELKQEPINKILQIKQSNLKQLRQLAQKLNNELMDLSEDLVTTTSKASQLKDQSQQLYQQIRIGHDKRKRLAFLLREQQHKGTLSIIQSLAQIVLQLTSQKMKRRLMDQEKGEGGRLQQLQSFLTFYKDSKKAIMNAVKEVLS